MTNPTADAFEQGFDQENPETPSAHVARVKAAKQPNWDGRLPWERNRLTEQPDGSVLCEFWNDYSVKPTA